MQLKITDDFDLQKIVESGQCFRPCEKIFNDQKFYRFITKNHVLYIRRLSDEILFEISCSAEDWNQIWIPYFDLETNYKNIRQSLYKQKPMQFIRDSVEFSKGLRILQQDHFETLISFIISQQKSIPSIKKIVEKISENYGSEVETEFETVHLFPTIDQLSNATDEELKSLSLGYRSPYILDAVKKSNDLESLDNLTDVELLNTLQKINGVGKKVSNCIALYSYHRLNCVPVDTWIKKALSDNLDNMDLQKNFDGYAGIVQQYIYYYKRSLK